MFRLRLPASVTASLGGGKSEKLQNMVKAWNEGNDVTVLNSVKGVQSPQTPSKTGGGAGSQTGTPRRTLCTPVFEQPNTPVNTALMGVPHQKMLLAKFEEEEFLCFSLAPHFRMTLRLQGQCIPPVNDKVQVCIDKNLSVWLANATEETLEVSSGELFGFNVGEYIDKTPGAFQIWP